MPLRALVVASPKVVNIPVPTIVPAVRSNAVTFPKLSLLELVDLESCISELPAYIIVKR
ncbi:MAG TPA: hypothetical protein VF941_17245 [Clostridia bacterium]